MEYFDLRTVLKPNVQKILKKDRKELNSQEQECRNFFEQICEETDRQNTQANWRNPCERK